MVVRAVEKCIECKIFKSKIFNFEKPTGKFLKQTIQWPLHDMVVSYDMFINPRIVIHYKYKLKYLFCPAE